MTSQEAFKHTCKPGYWLWNFADADQPQDWREVVTPLDNSNKLFGYDQDEFMAKQYK